MNPGIHRNVPSEQYHAWPFASSTALRAMMKSSPAHARVGIVDSDSPSLRLGTAVHAAVLEPHRYDGLIRVEPKCDKRTKEGKALWESFELSMMPGQTRISEEQAATVAAIHAHVTSSMAARMLLDDAPERELSVVAEIEGVMCKCRCDAYGDGLVVDVKTTSGLAAPEEFAKTVWNFGYAIQASFYRMVLERAGLRAHTFAWIVCETQEPHGVACYKLDSATLDYFEPAIIGALHRWSECETDGIWPSYEDRIVRLELPAWMTRQLEGA